MTQTLLLTPAYRRIAPYLIWIAGIGCPSDEVRKFPDAKIIAIEPEMENFELLKNRFYQKYTIEIMPDSF
jgi:hypothetical protein